MKRRTLTALGLGVFALVFVSFMLRAFGQFLLGPRRATFLAGPVALLAGGLLVVVILIALAARGGLLTLED